MCNNRLFREFVDNEAEANEMANQSIEAIRAIGREGLDSQLSLKMTSMGLDISDEIVMNNMRRILEAAKENGVFVTLIWKIYALRKTIDIFKQVKI